MRKFITKTLLFILPIVILAVFMEYSLRQIPNIYAYKKDCLDKNAEKIEILILGDSHALNGINPSYFSFNAFNASHGSQPWDLDYEILNKYKDSFNNLKVIILNVSTHSFWRDFETLDESWRKSQYAIYAGIKMNSLPWYENTEFISNKFLTNINRLKRYFFSGELSMCDSLGYLKNKGTAYLQLPNKRHVIDNIFSEKNARILEKNLNILHSFSVFCSKRNVKLIFLVTPAYHTYRENTNTEQLNKMNETINDFVKEHPNCCYLNWFDDTDFVAEDFYNADHLNETGAEKLSKKLSQYIDTNAF